MSGVKLALFKTDFFSFSLKTYELTFYEAPRQSKAFFVSYKIYPVRSKILQMYEKPINDQFQEKSKKKKYTTIKYSYFPCWHSGRVLVFFFLTWLTGLIGFCQGACQGAVPVCQRTRRVLGSVSHHLLYSLSGIKDTVYSPHSTAAKPPVNYSNTRQANLRQMQQGI